MPISSVWQTTSSSVNYRFVICLYFAIYCRIISFLQVPVISSSSNQFGVINFFYLLLIIFVLFGANLYSAAKYSLKP